MAVGGSVLTIQSQNCPLKNLIGTKDCPMNKNVIVKCMWKRNESNEILK